MTTVLTKTWIHPDPDEDVSNPRLLLAVPPGPEQHRALHAMGRSRTFPDGLTVTDEAVNDKFTIGKVRRWLLSAGLTPNIAKRLHVYLQSRYASQASASVAGSGGTYTSFAASIYLKVPRSSFTSQPHSTITHEYGHVWAYWQLYMVNQGKWDRYLDFRGLAGDPRLDSSYAWDRDEIIAEDWRLTGTFTTAISQRPSHLNGEIPHPKDVPGLGVFLRETWTKPPVT